MCPACQAPLQPPLLMHSRLRRHRMASLQLCRELLSELSLCPSGSAAPPAHGFDALAPPTALGPSSSCAGSSIVSCPGMSCRHGRPSSPASMHSPLRLRQGLNEELLLPRLPGSPRRTSGPAYQGSESGLERLSLLPAPARSPRGDVTRQVTLIVQD